MKCVGRTLAAAAVAAATIAIPVGVGSVAAGNAPVECQVDGSTPTRLVSFGDQESGVGSFMIPAGATIVSLVVETYDNYDDIGYYANDRVAANQTSEKVTVWVGGQQIGGATDDVPELGPGGNTRSASQTSTLVTRANPVVVTSGGGVKVRHAGDGSSPNSVQVRKVTIVYEYEVCEGGYPVTMTSSKTNTSTTPITNSAPAIIVQAPASQPASTPGSGENPSSSPATPAANTPATPDVVIEPVGAITPAVAPAVLSATVTPASTGSASTPTQVASAGSTASASDSLPVTGSDSANLLQIGAVAAAAGLGMVAVGGFRRRKTVKI